VNASELKAFIIACHLDFTQLSHDAHLKYPRGAKYNEDAANGTTNCVSVVYKTRNLRSRLAEEEGKAVTDGEGLPQEGEEVILLPLVCRVTLNPNAFTTLPSDALQDHSKFALLFTIFDLEHTVATVYYFLRPMEKMTYKLLAKADLLFALLQQRLKTHIRWKVKVSQRNNVFSMEVQESCSFLCLFDCHVSCKTRYLLLGQIQMSSFTVGVYS
jgi:hypothetical protein